MTQSLVELTKDLVLTQIRAGQVSPEQMPEMIRAMHQQLLSLQVREESAPAPMPAAPEDWQESITQHTVRCLACGALFKQLSGRHLRLHDLDARSYRQKYGISPGHPLSARATMLRRREITRRSRPWEKTRAYRKAHGQNGNGVEAAPTTSPAPAKRKTRAKTKARRPAARKTS